MTDDQLQESLDSNAPMPAERDKETVAYTRLFNALDSSMHSRLSPGFAHRVTARIDQARSSSKNLYLVLIASTFTMILFSVLALAMLGGVSGFTLPPIAKQAMYLFLIVVVLSIIYSRIEKKVSHQL